MKRIRFTAFLLCLAVLLYSFAGITVLADDGAADTKNNGTRTDSYDAQFLEITVSDSFIILSESLKNLDPAWQMAHIDDPAGKKNEYKTLSLIAAYYDTSTNIMINFISKASSAYNEFDISGFSDEEMVEFAKKIAPTGNNSSTDVSSEGLKIADLKISAYHHPDMNMFRMELLFEGDNQDKELIYGSIVNGMLLQFSMDTRHVGNAGIKEDLFLEFLSGVRLTKKMTYEEYQSNQKKAVLVIVGIFGAGVFLMIAFYIASKVTKKKKKQRIAVLSENLVLYRKRKQEGLVKHTSPIYEFETDYTVEVIRNYCNFNAWFKHLKRDLLLAVIYLAFVGYAIYLGSKLVLIVGVTAVIIIFYMRYAGSEKYCANLIKRYDLKKKKSITATYRFYEEYFTMSGIESISEFIYKQVFRVAIYKGFMLIYISEENALLLDMEKVPDEKRAEFVDFIYKNAKIES